MMLSPTLVDNNISAYATRGIIQMKDKLTDSSKEENVSFIAKYIHKILRIFFDTDSDKDHYNITILCTIDNPNKINNIGTVIMTVDRFMEVEQLNTELLERKYMVFGSYTYLNSTLIDPNSNKKGTFDICFSSIPISKDRSPIQIDGVTMYHSSFSVYIFNGKIGDVLHTSMYR
jgi:hypothetical protein